jgi:hypothetical protein
MRSMRPFRLRSCLVRIACAVLCFAVALVAVEAWARLANPFGICLYRDNTRYLNEAIEFPPGAQQPLGRLFEQRKGLALAFTEFTLHTDVHGLRVPEAGATPRVPRPQGAERTLRVLCLGDSVTFAWGVEERDGWVRVLERTTRARDGRALECLNAGHPKYNTIEEADWLAAHGDVLEPDAVVLTYVVNDIEDQYATYTQLMAASAAAASARPSLRERALARARESFYGLHGLLTVAGVQRELGRASGGVNPAVETLPEYAHGWPASRAALERVRAWCAARAIPLLVFDATVPTIAAVRAWCDEVSVPCTNLRFSEAEWARGVVISKADSHFNALGNAILARKAAAALRLAGLAAPE